jgi:hypothetical protein
VENVQARSWCPAADRGQRSRPMRSRGLTPSVPCTTVLASALVSYGTGILAGASLRHGVPATHLSARIPGGRGPHRDAVGGAAGTRAQRSPAAGSG